MQRLMTVIAMLVLVVIVSGCAGGEQNLLQNGQTAVTWPDAKIRFMRETPQPTPRECPISMLIKVKYLEEKTWPWYRADKWFSHDKPDQFFSVCPDRNLDPKNDIHLATWEPIGLVWSPSPFRTVAPSAVQALGLVAAAGTLGATMPKPVTNVNQVTNTMPGARFSTGYFNATPAPAWLGQ